MDYLYAASFKSQQVYFNGNELPVAASKEGI